MGPRGASLIPSAARVLALALCTAGAVAQQAPPPPPATQAAIDTAIDKGAAYLLGVYGARLRGGGAEMQEAVGHGALSLYTLLKAGVPKEDPVVRALVTHVI